MGSIARAPAFERTAEWQLRAHERSFKTFFRRPQIDRLLTFALDSPSNESVGVVCPQCGPSA